MTPFVLLTAYAAGIVMVHVFAPWNLAGYVMTIASLLLLWGCFARSRLAWIPLLLLLTVAGFFHASLQLKPPSAENHISRFAGTSLLTFEATLLTVERRAAGGYRLLAEMRHVVQKQGASPVFGKVLLYVKEGELTARPGQVVRWRSRLRLPSSFGNPGEFDYPLYLAANGIYATAFITDAAELVVLVNHPQRQDKILDNVRHDLAAHIEQVIPEDAVAYMQSLLLGIRGGISNDQRQFLAGSGVAHLFAISGLHFGLLALFLYQGGKWFYTRSQRLMLWCPPQRILPILLIIPLGAYLLLTGNAWATRRAFLMVSAVALLLARDHRTPPQALLAAVAFILLLFNPLALFQPGFQLSFAGVAGILIWLPRWQGWFAEWPKAVRWLFTLMFTTTAATLATAPATLWHFHQFAPAGLLTNLVAIPVIAWGAVPVGLASMAILPFSTMIADWGLLISARLVTFAIGMVSAISQWPGLAAIPIYLTVSSLIVLCGSILLLLPFGRERHHLFCRLAILLTTLAAAWLTRPQFDNFEVTALSVGQGDATLVSLAGDHYLVDGGGLPGSSIDPGEQLIAPALGRRGIERLQGVVLTHNHPDHSAGLVTILKRFPVQHFYYAGETARLAPELQEALQQQQVAIHDIGEGWTHLQQASGQVFSLFAPLQNAQDINERSIAVFAGNQAEGVLLTADLGEKGLHQLSATELPGRASLLKLPHHGSRHAQPEQYLDWTQPTLAFVSSGRDNRYGFPHQQTIQACLSRQIPLFRTDLNGMLTFHVANGQWYVRTGRVL